jgi:hypothetical protein
MMNGDETVLNRSFLCLIMMGVMACANIGAMNERRIIWSACKDRAIRMWNEVSHYEIATSDMDLDWKKCCDPHYRAGKPVIIKTFRTYPKINLKK